MNKEERKEYNKIYYGSKKEDLLKKSSKLDTCEFCSRCISHSHMSLHKKTTLCLSNRKQYIKITDLDNEIEKRIKSILDKENDNKNNVEEIINILNNEPTDTNIIHCECGSNYKKTNHGEYYHKQTKKHIRFISKNNI